MTARVRAILDAPVIGICRCGECKGCKQRARCKAHYRATDQRYCPEARAALQRVRAAVRDAEIAATGPHLALSCRDRGEGYAWPHSREFRTRIGYAEQ